MSEALCNCRSSGIPPSPGACTAWLRPDPSANLAFVHAKNVGRRTLPAAGLSRLTHGVGEKFLLTQEDPQR